MRLSRDGVPVLVHDAYFRRGAVPYPVAAASAATLARYGVPALADVYRSLGTDFQLSLDVKVRRAARPAVDAARAAGAVGSLWLVHDEIGVLRGVRAYDAHVRLVHEARPPGRDDAVATADARARVLATHRIDAENRHWGSWDASQVTAMHAHGVLAFGSLVHEPGQLRDAASRGLDALYCDHVDALVDALRERGA